MFNPEHLLGQLMGDAISGQLGGGKRKRSGAGLGALLGGGGLPTATKAPVGLGLLGVAYAAYQHYAKAGAAAPPLAMTGQAPPPPPPGATGATPPPPPPAAYPRPRAWRKPCTCCGR